MRVIILSITAFALAGCGFGSEGNTDLGELRDFHGYPVYYPGSEAGGNHISDIRIEDFGVRPRSQSRWLIFYGNCEPKGGDEPSCALPVEIQNYPICRRWPGMYARKPRLFDFRGAKATWGGGGTIEVYTGRTTVVIFTSGGSASRSRKLARQIALHLRTVKQTRPGELSEPTKGSLWKGISCLAKPA